MMLIANKYCHFFFRVAMVTMQPLLFSIGLVLHLD